MKSSASRRASELRSVATNLLRVANEIEAETAPSNAIGPRTKPTKDAWSDLNQELMLTEAVKIYRTRQRRSRHFSDELFGEPAWDMLLDLFAARLQKKRISVTSACTGSGVPSTTALRWLRVLEGMRLIERFDNEADQRVTWVRLTDLANKSMVEYFEDINQSKYQSMGSTEQYVILGDE